VHASTVRFGAPPSATMASSATRDPEAQSASVTRRQAARPIRVLYVIDSLAAGGAERSLAVMAPHFAAYGVELEVAALRRSENGVGPELEGAGIRLFDLTGPYGRWGSIDRCRRLVGARRPDLVHTTLFESDVAGRIASSIARVPVVTSLVNVAYTEEHVRDPHLRAWRVRGAQAIDALTAHLAARFHAITSHVADEMAARLRIARARIDVVPRGRDPEALGKRSRSRRAQARRALGAEPRSWVVLAAARHEYQKGLDTLVRAFPEIARQEPRARLYLAGRSGNQSAELEALIRELRVGDLVRVLGARTDVPDLLCAADVFVLPSRWEGFGSVLVEAMALRAPIVASDLGPVREAVGDSGVAALVPVDHPGELSRAVVATLRDAAGRTSMAEQGYARFRERFTIDRVTGDMVRFYERALGRSVGAA
jgi:glycosyltransferase involved in cell wall biosynthesis